MEVSDRTNGGLIDKAILLILLPAFFLLLVLGLVAVRVNSNKPIRVKLRGLGVTLELDTNEKEHDDKS